MKSPIQEIGREDLPLDKLEPMAGNREHGSGMSAKSLKELADSIVSVGIQQDLIVRKHPDKKGHYQIIAGGRRHAAAEKAGLKKAPCKIVEADDQTAYELRCIENLQREDLHELEEAHEFQNLLGLRDEQNQPVHTWESIAKAVGKSTAYVRGRVKLLDMPALAQQAFLNGKLTDSSALLVCRIPNPADAQAATLAILAPIFRAPTEADALNPENEAMSYREAKKLIQEKFMRRLKGSVFDQEDATLVSEFDVAGQDLIPGSDAGARHGGGPCSSCPCRTANMKVLYPDLQSEDVCTNTGCYALKVKAHEKRETAKFADKGQKLLPAKKAENIVNHDGSVNYRARDKYLPLDAVPEGSKKTVGEILEKAGVEHEVHVARVSQHEGKPKSVPLVPIGQEVLKALKKAGVDIKLPEAPKTAEDAAHERAEREARHALLTTVAAAVEQQLGEKLRQAKRAGDVRAMAGAALLTHGDRTCTPKQVDKLDDRELFARLFESHALPRAFSWHGTEFDKAWLKVCEEFGVDAKAILKQAEQDAEAAATKADTKAEKKTKK